MKVKFTWEGQIYPHGEEAVVVRPGDEMEVNAKYGALLIEKGHAKEVAEPAPEPEKKTR